MRQLFQQKYNSVDPPLIKSGTAYLIISPQGETYGDRKIKTGHSDLEYSNQEKPFRRRTSERGLKKSPLENGFRGVFFLLIAFMLSSNLEAQTLQTYQQEAAQNNPELKAAFNHYLSELVSRPQVGALPDPEVAFAYFISPIETRLGPQNARISVNQMFPWFGTLSEKRSVSDANAKAQFEQFQEQRNRMFYQMEVIWSDLYEVNKNIEMAEENLGIINTLLEVSLSRYENGLTSQVDVLRAQIEQEDLKTQIELLKDNRELLIQRFNEYRNVESGAMLSIPESISTPEINGEKGELTSIIKRQNPNLNKLRYREEASQEMVSLASRDGKPSFGIGFDYIATGERTDVANLQDNGKDAFIARASFRIPLFRNKYSAKVQQAELNLNSVQQDIIMLENKLETDFYTAIRDLNDGKRRYQLYDQKQIQRVEQAINIMMEAYSSEASDFEEILRLQRKLLGYQLKRIQADADVFTANSYIRYLTGANNTSLNEINY